MSDSSAAAAASPSMPADESVAGGRGRILLVDDDPLVLRGLRRELRHVGFEVDAVGGGPEALAALHAATYDVVVSDITMPGMNGIALLRAIREVTQDVAVVLMTADPSVPTAVQAVELGAVRYLIKPFDTHQLQEVVAYAVRVRRLAAIKKQALELHGERKQMIDGPTFDRALDGLFMVFQPIISWGRRRVHGYEALVRSTLPALANAGGLVEAAERLGRLRDLGRAVRASVASAIADAPPDTDIFVNLHSEDLLDETLYAATAPLAPHARRVVFEITERASLDHVTNLRHNILQLRQAGYRIAVDDLGSGYAGLNTLAQLEPEVVKLDMSLVRDVERQPTQRKLISSMVQMCRELGIVVVAEGVESGAERDVLLGLGCDLLQGFLFARPARMFPVVDW